MIKKFVPTGILEPLDSHPGEKPDSATYKPICALSDEAIEEQMRKRNWPYEVIDFENDQCQITAFKKHSLHTKGKKENIRLNCFVTSFPFSGEDQKKVDSSLQNEEKILKQILP